MTNTTMRRQAPTRRALAERAELNRREWERDLLTVRCACPVLCLIMAVGFALQVPLGVFGAQAPLDDLAHFVWPATLGSFFAREIFLDPRAHSRVHTFLLCLVCGVAAEAFWECLEYALDARYHWGLQIDNADTMGDILTGIAGATVGGLGHLGLDRMIQR